MNKEQMITELEKADEILGRLLHNLAYSYDDRDTLIIKDVSRLKSLVTKVDLLLNSENEKQQ